MSAFLLEIITPRRIAYSDQVEMVTVPSSNGMLGILPKHIPLFTRLVEGEVKITQKGQELFLAIGGGFMEVIQNKVMILVTDAYHADEINEKEVIAAKRAEEALVAKPEGAALIEAQSLIRRSTIALRVFKRKKGYPQSAGN